MPIVKMLVDKNLEEKRFFEEIEGRLGGKDLTKNPFKSDLRMISDKSKLLVLLDLEPIYPDIIPKVGLLLITVSLIFSWMSTLIAGIILSLTFVLWTDRFFFFVLKRARKKQGLSGEIRLLSNKEAMRGVMRLWDR